VPEPPKMPKLTADQILRLKLLQRSCLVNVQSAVKPGHS
jgi:hypothetical protein